MQNYLFSIRTLFRLGFRRIEVREDGGLISSLCALVVSLLELTLDFGEAPARKSSGLHDNGYSAVPFLNNGKRYHDRGTAPSQGGESQFASVCFHYSPHNCQPKAGAFCFRCAEH